MKIVLIHGFNVSDGGKGTIDKLELELKKQYPTAIIDKDSADYGWQFLLRVNYFYWFGNTITRISKALESADLVFTHSNGANYCHKALKKINNPNIELVHYSPALNKDHKFKEVFKCCDVYYTKHDKPTWWAKFMPFSSWGSMGRDGPTTIDKRVTGHNESDTYRWHSDWFQFSKLKNTIKMHVRARMRRLYED